MLLYYEQFIDHSNPLAEAGCLTAEECNIAFWYRFHPNNWQELESHHLLDYSRLDNISFQEVFEITYLFFANPPTSQLQQLQFNALIERHESTILKPVSVPLATSTPPFPASHPPPECPPKPCHPTAAAPPTQFFRPG